MSHAMSLRRITTCFFFTVILGVAFILFYRIPLSGISKGSKPVFHGVILGGFSWREGLTMGGSYILTCNGF
jgi:hypothetical protein